MVAVMNYLGIWLPLMAVPRTEGFGPKPGLTVWLIVGAVGVALGFVRILFQWADDRRRRRLRKAAARGQRWVDAHLHRQGPTSGATSGHHGDDENELSAESQDGVVLLTTQAADTLPTNDASTAGSGQSPVSPERALGNIQPYEGNPVNRETAFSDFDLLGDPTKGGRPATAHELVVYQGKQSTGVPNGLDQCPRCGAWAGECLDPSPVFEGMMMRVHCGCDADLCHECGKPFHRWKLNSNYYDPEDEHIWHVPGFLRLTHQCDRESASVQ